MTPITKGMSTDIMLYAARSAISKVKGGRAISRRDERDTQPTSWVNRQALSFRTMIIAKRMSAMLGRPLACRTRRVV